MENNEKAICARFYFSFFFFFFFMLESTNYRYVFITRFHIILNKFLRYQTFLRYSLKKCRKRKFQTCKYILEKCIPLRKIHSYGKSEGSRIILRKFFFFFLQTDDNFALLLLCKINVLSIFHIIDSSQIFMPSRNNPNSHCTSHFWLRVYV